MIEIIDVHKSFGSKEILRGVNLKINKSENLVVIGRSGIGKSVMLKIICGLLPLDKGQVLFEGKDIWKMNENELFAFRKRIGFLFQSGALLKSLNVYDNLALPLREHEKMAERNIKEEVEKKLQSVGLKGIENLMPEHLSGGMLRRVGLARAIIRNPEIVFYDEPTAGLDLQMVNQIIDLIIQLRDEKGITSVVVTHDLPAAFRIADRIAFLHEGKVVKLGDAKTFLESEEDLVRKFIFGEIEEEKNESQ